MESCKREWAWEMGGDKKREKAEEKGMEQKRERAEEMRGNEEEKWESVAGCEKEGLRRK